MAVAALLALPAAAQDQPVAGGTLNMIVQPEPPMLMLGLNQQGPVQFVGGQIYQSLLTYGTDLSPQPSLAKSWEVSADGLTYTFKLQDGVKWHDGQPFTAEDVVFTGSTFLTEAHPRWRLIHDTYVDSITAPDPATVVFKLKKPFSAFLSSFELSSFPVVPKHIYAGTDFRTNPANQTPIGTGPFKFQEWKRGSYIHLVKNPDYWIKGQPYLDDLYFRVIPDAASRAVAFEQGTVDVLRGGDVEGFEVARLAELPGVQSTTSGWDYYSPLAFMAMNLRKPPFDNKLVRQAVMHAIDRDFVAQTVLFGQAKPATGPIASTTKYYSADVPAYPYDMDKARALIAQSGVDIAATPVSVMAMPYGSQWERLAEYARQQLDQLGFKTTVKAVDAGGWSQAVSDFDFNVTFNFTYQYSHPALGVARHYLSGNIVKGTPFGNNEGYVNARADELLTAGAQAPDDAAAAAAYAEAQKLLVDDVALGWLYEQQNTTLWQGKVHNLVRSGIGLNEAMDDVWIGK